MSSTDPYQDFGAGQFIWRLGDPAQKATWPPATRDGMGRPLVSERPPSFLPGLALACWPAGSIAFSGKAIIVKLAYRHGVDAVTLLMYRMLFALPLFVA
jgi:hypothetical protein